AEGMSEDHAQAGYLGHRKVDEDDAARKHLHAQWNVGRRHEQAGDERRPQDAEARRVERHFNAPSKRWIVSSNNPKRSLALSVPPTVKGTITVGILARLERNCAACELLYGE